METANERLHILDMIDEGQISAQEGLRMLQGLNEGGPVEEPELPLPGVSQAAGDAGAAEPDAPASRARAEDTTQPLHKWKRWWTVPFWVGVAVTVFGGVFMYQAMHASGYGFWFFCASLPFMAGLVLIVLAWQARNLPWLHLRIQQTPGRSPEQIALSFPLPLQLAAWFTNTFGRFIPEMRSQELSQMIQAAGGNISPENPIFIEVPEGDGGHVEIYIG